MDDPAERASPHHADRLASSVRWFREHVRLGVALGIVVEVGLALLFRHVPQSIRPGISVAVAILPGLVVALVNGAVAGCLVATVGGIAFVLLVYNGSDTPPAASGIPLILVWVAIAALAGIVSERLRRRTTLALGSAAAAREEAEAARERAERLAARAMGLQRMTAGLGEAVTVHDVAKEILGPGLDAMVADGGLLAILDEEATTLNVIERRSIEPAVVGAAGPVGSIPVGSPGLLSDPVRTRTAAFVSSADELARRFPSIAQAASATDFNAWSVVPLIGSAPLGVLCFAYTHPRAFEPPERESLATFASQSAQALERAQLYEGQRRVAEVLQRSLLPDRVDTVPPVRAAARYLAGGPNVEVGGDWYDLLPLPDGRLGVAIGDVVGRGTRAAAVMGHFRTALRAYALAHEDPGEAIGALSRHLRVYEEVDLATLLYATLEPGTGRLRYANAGHPPALIRSADGRTRFLDARPAPPLGAGDLGGYLTSSEDLPEGGCIVLYTDGLIERRGESLDEGFARLVDAVRTSPADPEAMCDHLLAALLGGRNLVDDVAVIVLVRDPVPTELRLRLPARPAALPGLRQHLRAWLAARGAPDEAATDAVIAVSEAANNAIEHAYGAGDGAFDVHAWIDGQDLFVDVRDDGAWRDRHTTEPAVVSAAVGGSDQASRPDPSERASRATAGRGIGMIRSTMDEVRVERSDSGTRVSMRRRLWRTVP